MASYSRRSKMFLLPALLLRNILIRKDAWHKYPNGFDRIQEHMVLPADPDVYQDWYCTLMNIRKRKMREEIPTPEKYGMDYEQVEITTRDKVKLNAYLIKASSCKSSENSRTTSATNQSSLSSATYYSNAPTILYFHGNTGNIGLCLPFVLVCRTNPDLLECNFLLVDYRGYGRSRGEPTEIGLYEDAKAAFDYLEQRQDIDSTKIVVHGHSLGGALAIYLASHKHYRDKVAALILENTFTSIPNMAQKLYSEAARCLCLCCYNVRFESDLKIDMVRCPTLFQVGLGDQLIPRSMSEQLFEKCVAEVKVIYKFERMGHNDTFLGSSYPLKYGNFLRKHVFYLDGKREASNLTAHVLVTKAVGKESQSTVYVRFVCKGTKLVTK